ncbi:MAG: DNA repair exonuclease [Granulosicoccus sp.]|nr:DNA repair exonuclease [Granulosicoccus sp.]
MIKLIHTADIHLDSPLRSLAMRDEALREKVYAATRDAFVRLVDYSLSEQISALLISGDLFDGTQRSAKSAAFLVGQLERLRSSGIQVFYIKGNHDAINPMAGAVDLPDNVHVFGGRGARIQLLDLPVWIHGVSYRGKHAQDSLLDKFSAPVEHAVNIAMLHTSLAGSVAHDPYAPCTVADLKSMGFDYWALGHIHKRQVHATNPWIVMPGIPQGRDMGELGPKSATLICLDDRNISIQEIPTSELEFLVHSLDITGIESDDDLRDLLRSAFASLVEEMVSDNAIVRLSLTGSPNRRWQLIRDAEFWQEAAVELAGETDHLWIDRLDFDFESEPVSQIDDDAVNELKALMQTIASEESFKDRILIDAKAVLDQIPVNERSKLIPDEKALQLISGSAAEDGADYLYALMKGRL